MKLSKAQQEAMRRIKFKLEDNSLQITGDMEQWQLNMIQRLKDEPPYMTEPTKRVLIRKGLINDDYSLTGQGQAYIEENLYDTQRLLNPPPREPMYKSDVSNQEER